MYINTLAICVITTLNTQSPILLGVCVVPIVCMCILAVYITQMKMGYKTKKENESKLKAFISNKDQGGASCCSIPFDLLEQVWIKMQSSTDRRDIHFALSLRLGICTGLRSKDLLDLRRFNLHRDDLTTRCYIEGKASKTGKVYKKPISQNLYDSLYENAVDNDEGLLIHNNGKAYQHGWLSRRIQRSFESEFKAAKLEGKRKGERITIGAHSLRKTYGMMLYKEKGINAARIGLQHESLATTSKYLGVGIEEQIEMEADVFGARV